MEPKNTNERKFDFRVLGRLLSDDSRVYDVIGQHLDEESKRHELILHCIDYDHAHKLCAMLNDCVDMTID